MNENNKLIYVSFLGAGNYKEAMYQWNDTCSKKTKYIQIAALQILQQSSEPFPDFIRIFGTETSQKEHWNPKQGNGLLHELMELGLKEGEDFAFSLIHQELSTPNQWQDFQNVLSLIPSHSELIFDMTHGFRSVPIVFSTAIQFLKLTKNVRIKHVLYGVYLQEEPSSKIVDYVDFYEINDWTDAVSRLVEQADARKLSEVAQRDSVIQLSTKIEDTALPSALRELTNSIRNVEANQVHEKAEKALEIVRQVKSSFTDNLTQILMEMVENKFIGLVSTPPLNGEYSPDYFRVQIALAKILAEHKLFMQTYTILEEAIASLGMRYYPKKVKYTTGEGKRKRIRATVFLQMIQYKDNINFSEQSRRDISEKLKPFYEHLDKLKRGDENRGLLGKILSHTSKIELKEEYEEKISQNEQWSLLDELYIYTSAVKEERNGFNHAFTSKMTSVNKVTLEESIQIIEELRAIFEYIFKSISDVRPSPKEIEEQEDVAEHIVFDQEEKEAHLTELIGLAFDGKDIRIKANLYKGFFTEEEVNRIIYRGKQAKSSLNILEERFLKESMQKSKNDVKRFKEDYPEYEEQLEILQNRVRQFKDEFSRLKSSLLGKPSVHQQKLKSSYLNTYGTREELQKWEEKARTVRKKITEIKTNRNISKEECKRRFLGLISQSPREFKKSIEGERDYVLSRHERRVENTEDLIIEPTNLKHIYNLEPQPSWTLVIDETGDEEDFEREDENVETLGRFAGVIIPTNSTDVSKYIHCSTASRTNIHRQFSHILSQDNWSIVGLTMNDLPFVTGEQWIDGVSEIIAWVLRLLPLHKDGTEIIVKIEARGKTHKVNSQVDRIQRLLLQEMARFAPERAKNITLKIMFVNKKTNWVSYADVIAYMWPQRDRVLRRMVKTSGIEKYLWENISPILRSCLDTYLSEKPSKLSGYQWRNMLLENSDLGRRITDLWIQRCSEDEQLWRMLLEDLALHLDSKSINMFLVSKQADFLNKSNEKCSFESPLIWSTLLNICRIAQNNHEGRFFTDEEIDSFQGNRSKLLDENVRHVCFMDLHLAVSMTNSYQFGRAEELLDDWKSDECLRSIGYNYRGRVCSSLGQHAAFRRQYDIAEKHFDKALSLFKKLSDPKESMRECSQTRNYKIVNMVCRLEPIEIIWNEFQKQLPTLRTNRVDFLAQTGDFAHQYNLYLYLRILYTYLLKDGSSLAEVERYLSLSEHWQTHTFHPWPMINMYRALLYESIGRKTEGKEYIKLAINKCKNDGIMCIIKATLKKIDNLYFHGNRQINYKSLFDKVPHAKQYINALRDVKESEKPSEWLPKVLPFNFH